VWQGEAMTEAPPVTPGTGEPVLPSTGGGGANDGIADTGGGGGDGDSGSGKHKNRRSRLLVEAVIVVVVALALAVVLRTFVVQTFYIPSGSMLPTLKIGDRILVDKLSYHLHSVDRGDIVVFQRPPTENCGGTPVNDLVKRVIGLPNETISVKQGEVWINGHELKEPWLPEVDSGVTGPGPPNDNPFNLQHPYHIPSGEYFLMGDNRTQSCDSRFWGPIQKSLIVGKVVVRVWPLSSFKIF
jgi:signal peptidase I